MYTQYAIDPRLQDRLTALEEELDVPIRMLRFGRGTYITPWLDGHQPEGTSLEVAERHGITVAINACPRQHDYTPELRLAGESELGAQFYDVYRPMSEPAAPISVQGNIVGEVQPRVVYDYINLTSYTTLDIPDLFDAIGEAVRQAADTGFIESWEQRQREVEREQLIEFARHTYGAQIEQRRATIDGFQTQIVAYQDGIATYASQLREEQKMLDALLLVQDGESGEQMIREWDQLSQHSRVRSLAFEQGSVKIVTTDDLRLHRPDTDETRWLGSFEITLNVVGSQITLRNLDTVRGGRDHPHVNNGRPCLGGHETAFYQLLGRGELYTVFELLLQYLETLNMADEYGRYGSYWFNVDDERPLVAEAVPA